MASATMRRYINFLTVNENVETKLAFFHTNDCTFVLSYTFPLMFLIFPKANQGSSQSGGARSYKYRDHHNHNNHIIKLIIIIIIIIATSSDLSPLHCTGSILHFSINW